MNSIEFAVLFVSWCGVAVLAAALVLLGYVILRLLTDALMRRGLFPVALAPALIIAARLRATKGDKGAVTAHIVLKEIARAEKASPGFQTHIEAIFPRRHDL